MRRLAMARRVDSRAFFLILAYVVLAAFGLLILIGLTKTSHDESQHRREIVANANAIYTSCVKSIPLIKRLERHFHGAALLASVLTRNARETVLSTPKSDPQWVTREENWQRLRRAFRDISTTPEIPIPTHKVCLSNLRSTLGADAKPPTVR